MHGAETYYHEHARLLRLLSDTAEVPLPSHLALRSYDFAGRPTTRGPDVRPSLEAQSASQ